MATDIVISKLGAGLPVSPFKGYATFYRALDHEALTGALSGEPIARYAILNKEAHGANAALFRMPVSLESPFNSFWLNVGANVYVQVIANDARYGDRDIAVFTNPYHYRAPGSRADLNTAALAVRVINALGACSFATIMNVGWVMEERPGGYLLTIERHDGMKSQTLFESEYDMATVTVDLLTGKFLA